MITSSIKVLSACLLGFLFGFMLYGSIEFKNINANSATLITLSILIFILTTNAKLSLLAVSTSAYGFLAMLSYKSIGGIYATLPIILIVAASIATIDFIDRNIE